MGIKCVVWDLDNTLWEGVLLEGDEVRLRQGAKEAIQTLDEWGILHSIASHNDQALAEKTLQALEMRQYFVAPQINFTPKPDQIAAISQALDLRLEDLAYVDDDPFQRAQVASLLPEVIVLSEAEGLELPSRAGIRPEPLTPEARSRRLFYQSRILREQAQANFAGSRIEFLKSCDLRLVIRSAQKDDLPRLYELIWRTNQLNATAQRYELNVVQGWVEGSEYEVWVADLTDRFGAYGMVGAAVICTEFEPWLLQLLLVSCRAMGRGVGEGLLVTALRQAKEAGQSGLRAYYRQTAYNQAMRLLLATHGFRLEENASSGSASESERSELWIYRRALKGNLPAYPVWLKVEKR